MGMITRQGLRLVQDYYDQVKEGDSTPPDDDARRTMSTILDGSFYRAYQEFTSEMKQSPLLIRGSLHIQTVKNCGGFKPQKACLKQLTPFEQMLAMGECFRQNPDLARGRRTYAMHVSNEEIVPVFVASSAKISATLWTTVIGWTKGQYKAPSYETLTQEDPQGTYRDSMIDLLTSLEIHRNPSRQGALVIKASSYDAARIDHVWRYQSYAPSGTPHLTASAELKRQHSFQTRSCVAQSAGYNFSKLLDEDITQDRDENLMPLLLYQEFSQEGYRDNVEPNVTPSSILETLPEALKGNVEPLDALTRKVFASRLGHSKIPGVEQNVIETLFPKEQDR